MVVNLLYSKKFQKHYKQRILPDNSLVRHYQIRISYFINNPSHPLLRNHRLKGTQKDYCAFSVTGDTRIIYRRIDDQTVELLDIGTHNQVYS